MRRLVLVAATIVMLTGILAAQCGGSRGQRMSHDNGEAAIRAVLDSQVSAWNRGDLEGFMTGYWNSPDLTFFSAGTQTSGWDADAGALPEAATRRLATRWEHCRSAT